MKTFSKSPKEVPYKTIGCPVCGGERFEDRWALDGFGFSRCKTCGLVLQNPQPQSAELLQRYDREYFDYEIQNEENFFQLMVLGLKDIGFFEHVEYPLLESSAGSCFLDIGCATGKLLSFLKGRGWRTKGIEVCPPAAQFAREERNLDVFIGTLEDAALEDASCDVVHASHLIEHLNRPDEFVKETFRVLKSDGRLFITTPNISGMQARLFGGQWRSAIADHMFLFSRKTLTSLLEKYGFRVEKSATWGGIAAGMAPKPVKQFADWLVKQTGWGDVMILQACKKT